MKKYFLLMLAVLGFSYSAHAFEGIRTYAGFGFANYGISSPSQNFNMNSGFFAMLGGEKSLDDSGLSVTFFFNYMKSDGDAGYDYTSGTTRYTGNGIDFDSSNYQIGLGLRQRFMESTAFRPYVEGGGLFGYHTLSFNPSNASSITASGPGAAGDYKTSESHTGMGFYGEGGAEMDLAESFGIKLGLRYQYTETQAFQTLGDQKLTFNSLLFVAGLALRF